MKKKSKNNNKGMRMIKTMTHPDFVVVFEVIIFFKFSFVRIQSCKILLISYSELARLGLGLPAYMNALKKIVIVYVCII